MEMETNYSWIVYQTTNKVNNKIYVGVHKTKDPYKFDGYIGCGIYISLPNTYLKPKTNFLCAVKKHGVKQFIRQTILIFDNPLDAYMLEAEIVNELFLKRTDVYNMILGGEYIIPPKVKTYKYDIEGNFICEYESVLDAAEKNGVTHSAIWHAIASKQKSCNCYWNTDKFDKLDLTAYNDGDNHRVAVYLYDLLGYFIQLFASYNECAKYLDISIATVRQAAIQSCTVLNKYKISYVLAKSYSEANTIYTMNRTVYQYDSNGKYLNEYLQQEALKKYPKSNISKCIRLKLKDYYGFIWALIKVPEYFSKANRSNSKKKVGKYTLSGELVCVYDSATKAAKENGTSVWKVLNGTNKTHKQHIYKYLD